MTIHRTLIPLLVAVTGWPLAARAQASLPFGPGEQCVYRGSTRLGRIGTGTMAVERSGTGNEFLLRFDFRGRVGIFGIEDRTRSWFSPGELASTRFTKHERSPITSRDEDVRMDVATRRWRGGNDGGAMTTAAPLDELSFLYFIRTLPLANGDSYTLARHYDPRRNPVTVRVIGRGTVTVPAGRFQIIEVEMRVLDPVRYRGEGVIQLHLTDDAQRALVRMESAIPRAGRLVLSLESGTGACGAASRPDTAAD
jgi:hypothetical protein